MKHLESIASGSVCNNLTERVLDCVLAEAPPGELGRGPEPGPPYSYDQASALPLGRQGGDRLRGGLVGDAAALEAPADRLVPVTTLAEGLRAAHRIPLVVHEADALQTVERLLTQSGRESPALQPQVELCRRLLAARDRSKRGVHRTGSAQLASELTQPRTLEGLPHAQPDPDDDFGRDRAPARSVELDGDPAASKLAKPGDDRHYAGSLTFSGSATASASTGAASGSAIGRSRAETT